MLDLFAGQLGWSKAFLARGWEVVAVDLVAPKEIPPNCQFFPDDILTWTERDLRGFNFVCASPPCEQFSVHGMKHFHPNPPHPELGVKLFRHTYLMCHLSGVRFVVENVRSAQQFVGQAVSHCGPFYLWGSGVPPIMPQGIKKNWESFYIDGNGRKRGCGPGRNPVKPADEHRTDGTARAATIPPELANCVADYAERILEANQEQVPGVSK